jgi:hypothetical protein
MILDLIMGIAVSLTAAAQALKHQTDLTLAAAQAAEAERVAGLLEAPVSKKPAHASVKTRRPTKKATRA